MKSGLFENEEQFEDNEAVRDRILRMNSFGKFSFQIYERRGKGCRLVCRSLRSTCKIGLKI